MRILVIGYGSMGRRRIRLIKQLIPGCDFICVDTNLSRYEQIINDGHVGFTDLTDALNGNPDLAFVCTSPGHHAEIILKLISAHIHVFTEINLVSDQYEEIIKLSRNENVKVFMSSTMLYDKQIIAIEDQIHKQPGQLTYIYHVGQYLPDWHPWESYKDFFIGKKETNGCREILAIQLPWIIKSFGTVEEKTVVKRRNTSLDIDFDDTFIVSMEHNNGNSGVFVCDVLARKAVTYLEVMGENFYLRWDGTPDSLYSLDCDLKEMKTISSYDSIEHVEGYADIISENQYIDEIKAFFDWVYENKTPSYSLADDKYILSLIDSIEGNLK